MVRAGKNSFLIDEFKRLNLVAIGWDLGDLTDKSPDEIKELVYQKYPYNENRQNGLIASQESKFRHNIKKGDYVLSYVPSTRSYIVGKVSSDYIYSDIISKSLENDDYSDIRYVEWLGEVFKDDLQESTQGTLGTQTTLFYINENAKKDILNNCKNKPNIVSTGKIWSMNVSRSAEYDEAWDLFKCNSCISIDYFLDNLDNNYSSYKSVNKLREFLNDEKSEQPVLINRFVNKVEKGDILIAHKGRNVLAGIGIVSSDYIYQNESLKHIRKVNWFYAPDNMQLKEGSFFKTYNIVRLDEEYSKFVNEVFARIAANDKNVRNNLLNFIFNKFYDNYFIKEDGQQFFKEYSVEKDYIKNCWELIEQSDSIEDKINLIWDDVFGRKVGVLQSNSNQLKNMNKNYFTNKEMDESILLFYNAVNNILNTSNVNNQRIILEQFANEKLSKGFGVGRLTPILYYLDDSFYPINKKTVATYNFISLAIGADELSIDLTEYIDNNIKYHEFLDNLRTIFPFDKCDMGDVRIFNEFSDWICGEDDYLWSKNANVLPIELLKNISQELCGDELFHSTEKRNIIYFGAPGTGKSYNLNQDKAILLKDYPENYERVTFHPDYSYANFVGTYKPAPENKSITYKYVPGPFMRILKKAIQKPSEPFLLIIEEINRANVAAVFGDVFQLLDRDENNESEYDIETSQDMRRYLNEDKIKLPANLFIWATMNSADQGVFPMDTAFKRRWDFKYFSINSGEDLIKNTKTILNGVEINWNTLRKAINGELLSYKINEDKLMGPFFAFNEFMNESIDEEIFKDIFKNKIIMYLFEDAARSRRNELFSGVSKTNVTYSQICERLDGDGIEIFTDSIKDQFIKYGDDLDDI